MNTKQVIGRTPTLLAMGVAGVLFLAGCDQAGGTAKATEAGPAVEPAATAVATTTPPEPTTPKARKPVTRPVPKAEPVPAADGGAVIEFTKRVHDFGEIWDVERQTCRFEFTNRGEETLVIKEIKTSCGCTAAKLDQMVFEPGEGDAIEVSFSPKGFGKQTKTVDVITENSWPERIPKLKIVATIKPFVEVEPYIIRYGSVKLGEAHRQVIEINSADKSMEITSVETESRAGSKRGDYLTAEVLDESATQEYGAGKEQPLHRIAVTLKDDAPWGQIYGTVKINARGRPDENGESVQHTKTVSVNAKVYGRISADENLFRVGTLKPGSTFSKEIKLTSTGGEKFAVLATEIVDSRMPEGQIRVHVVPVDGAAPGTAYRIVLSGEAKDYTGSVNGRVKVTTDSPGEEELIFTVGGIIRAQTTRR
ncbi:MAG: DUF1573 domain-containing protein [Planctomycetota bacterium]|jgi:hypothetical protein